MKLRRFLASILIDIALKILITGAGGFLGSALASRLSKMNYQVSLLVRANTHLSRISDLGKYKIGRCDADSEIVEFISNNSPDVVIHTAACYGRDGESITQLVASNIYYGTVILDAINELQKKVIFINTASVLPDNINLYALTKSQFEKLAMKFCGLPYSQLQFINVKLQHMYGPWDDDTKFTSYIIRSLKNNISSLPLTLGEQKRDFIYIDDVVNAFVKIIENTSTFNQCEKVELGSGDAMSIRSFVELAHKLTGSKTQLLFGEIPAREYDEMCLVANPQILKNLGWSPKFNIESGIKKVIQLENSL